ncbi:hypothetical protein [Sorangium sp. So ce131]|uniref:hypothetical protein n=1 Tax=Sorangium sp. So ce131 TaxID=3133282 RepID=UPI003F6360DE
MRALWSAFFTWREQHYVCAVEARDGLIVRYRGYWNPLVGIAAFGGEAAVRSAMVGEP